MKEDSVVTRVVGTDVDVVEVTTEEEDSVVGNSVKDVVFTVENASLVSGKWFDTSVDGMVVVDRVDSDKDVVSCEMVDDGSSEVNSVNNVELDISVGKCVDSSVLV